MEQRRQAIVSALLPFPYSLNINRFDVLKAGGKSVFCEDIDAMRSTPLTEPPWTTTYDDGWVLAKSLVPGRRSGGVGHPSAR